MKERKEGKQEERKMGGKRESKRRKEKLIKTRTERGKIVNNKRKIQYSRKKKKKQ